MKDGLLRRAVKRVARAHFDLNLWAVRAWRRARGERPYVLGGGCERCAACCEAPRLRVGPLTWHLRSARWLFLRWQERVNGFVLAGRERPRTFVFRCTHFDPATRSCDSYASRPGVCRDYPRLLLWQAAPEMLPGCGYRPVAANAERLTRTLARLDLTPEQREKLRRGLHLGD